MRNRVAAVLVNPTPPSGVVRFRIIIQPVDPNPCMAGKPVRRPVPRSMHPAADHIRLIANLFCKRRKRAGIAVAISSMRRQHIIGGLSLPAGNAQIRIFCRVTKAAAHNIRPACGKLLALRHIAVRDR